MKTDFLATLFLSIILLILLSISAHASSGKFKNDAALITENLEDGTEIKAEVKRKPIPKDFPYTNPLIWGGFYRGLEKREPPTTIVSEVNVTVGDKKAVIPFSAYADLGDPTRIRIVEVRASSFMVYIEGGIDGPVKYAAYLTFKNLQLIRTVKSLNRDYERSFVDSKYEFIPKPKDEESDQDKN